MILNIKEFYYNNLHYEINPQCSGLARDAGGTEYEFSYCRTVPSNCYIFPSSSEHPRDDMINGRFKFYENDMGRFIEFIETEENEEGIS